MREEKFKLLKMETMLKQILKSKIFNVENIHINIKIFIIFY